MDSVLRALAIYLVLVVIFRLVGRRALAQVTTFDFVLLLVIGEATQQALLGDDYSVTNAIIVISTLVGINIALSIWKRRSPGTERFIEGLPLVIVEHGKPLTELLNKARVDEADVMEAARLTQGQERMDQIKYAVVERNGRISIIPR